MSTIVTLRERKARAIAARRAAADQVMADLQIYAQQNGGRFIIYGSVARRSMRHDSDIDILVYFPAETTFAAYRLAEDVCFDAQLRPDISQLSWHSPAFLSRVMSEAPKLTDRYQTTVPSSVRKQLKLGKGDQIRYCTDANGRVYIEPVRTDAEDPALGAFLDHLESDIRAHPDRLRSFAGGLYDRLNVLIGQVDVDLDEPLSIHDE